MSSAEHFTQSAKRKGLLTESVEYNVDSGQFLFLSSLSGLKMCMTAESEKS